MPVMRSQRLFDMISGRRIVSAAIKISAKPGISRIPSSHSTWFPLSPRRVNEEIGASTIQQTLAEPLHESRDGQEDQVLGPDSRVEIEPLARVAS